MTCSLAQNPLRSLRIMAKKGKRNIKALLAKRAELQAINQKTTLSIPGAPTKPVAAIAELPEAPTLVALPAAQSGREIWRTLLATVIIAVLLAGVVISDRQSPYLGQLGDSVYRVLRLGD